jgi:hypothetical protein
MEGISSDQQTPILTGDFVWTVIPENGGPMKKQLVCFNRSDLRNPVWSSGKDRRFGRGLGPYIIKDDKMLLLDDDANLYLFRLEGSQATLISRHEIIKGIEAWGPMAVAGNHLLMRDARNLLCLFIGKNN